MAHREPATDAFNKPAATQSYRCACCQGIIESLSSETVPSGLYLRLSLVSDECELICNDCTARLVEENRSRARPAERRR